MLWCVCAFHLDLIPVHNFAPHSFCMKLFLTARSTRTVQVICTPFTTMFLGIYYASNQPKVLFSNARVIDFSYRATAQNCCCSRKSCACTAVHIMYSNNVPKYLTRDSLVKFHYDMAWHGRFLAGNCFM